MVNSLFRYACFAALLALSAGFGYGQRSALSFSTFLGGDGEDRGGKIAVDSAGSVYIVGATTSTNFPSPGSQRDRRAFVAKLDPAGTTLLYAVVLGAGEGRDIAVDPAGNAYVTGIASAAFTTTPGAFRASATRGAFVAKLGPTGELLYSTYLDSAGAEAFAIAADGAGNAYVAGTTFSADFPTTPGAFQRTPRLNDVFVTKLNPSGTALVYSTLVGGTANEAASGIAIDSGGNAFVTGGTGSTDFPTTAGAVQRAKGAGNSEDVFILKLNPGGTGLAYSTYIGGSGPDGGFDLALDSGNNAYVTGVTFSADFPVTPGTLPRGFAEPGDAFVSKLNPQGTALVYSTYLAGTGADSGSAIAVNATGSAYVGGATSSTDFPVTSDALGRSLGTATDAFAATLNPAGTALSYSTFLGGPDNDLAEGIAIDGAGNILVTGFAARGFPTTPRVVQGFPACGGFGDAFVAKITLHATASELASVNAASFRGAAVAAGSIATAYGVGLATASEAAASVPLPVTLAGRSVRVRDSAGVERAAPLFFVSPTQINFLVPGGTAAGQAVVTVSSDTIAIATGSLQVEPAAPGLFSANSNGFGPAAAVAVRIGPDGVRTTQLTFDCSAGAGNCTEAPINPGSLGSQIIVQLYGTGMRAASRVTARIGGQDADVLFAGAQGEFAGLDQINVRVPVMPIGGGRSEVELCLDGRSANPVSFFVQ